MAAKLSGEFVDDFDGATHKGVFTVRFAYVAYGVTPSSGNVFADLGLAEPEGELALVRMSSSRAVVSGDAFGSLTRIPKGHEPRQWS